MTDPAQVLADWHGWTRSRDAAALAALLADNVVFHSPVVHTPQRGKAVTSLYLQAALDVLGGADFTYVREFARTSGAVLEFVTVVDGITVNGIDMIEWNADGQITDFKVMVRPLKAVTLLHHKMAAMLERMKAG
jgi:hypothetical protein